MLCMAALQRGTCQLILQLRGSFLLRRQRRIRLLLLRRHLLSQLPGSCPHALGISKLQAATEAGTRV